MCGSHDDGITTGRFERLDGDPAIADWNPDDLQPSLRGDQAVRRPAGLLDRDVLDAPGAEDAAQDGEALREPGAHDGVLWLGCGSPGAAEIRHQRVAEVRRPARVVVAERRERS